MGDVAPCTLAPTWAVRDVMLMPLLLMKRFFCRDHFQGRTKYDLVTARGTCMRTAYRIYTRVSAARAPQVSAPLPSAVIRLPPLEGLMGPALP